MSDFLSRYLGVILALIAVAIVLTIVVFRRRMFDRAGPRQGDAVDPDKVRRDNPPDEWSRNH